MIHSRDNKIFTDSSLLTYLFYGYAALALLCGTIMLFLSPGIFKEHHFHPGTLAITHIMALGWGTMVILGASHQLVPVMSGKDLYSTRLGYCCFVLAAAGIPLLCYGFYYFRFDSFSIAGGLLINFSIITFLINISKSLAKEREENIYTLCIFTATVWLLATVVMGLLILLNFRFGILPSDSLSYLSWHAHMGIAGWFLLLIIGAASKLIPMFLLSKFESAKKVRNIYILINSALIVFILLFFSGSNTIYNLIPAGMILLAMLLFARYIYLAYSARIRNLVENPVMVSISSLAFSFIPVLILAIILVIPAGKFAGMNLTVAYGFTIFFGWISVIILGMTFKTLPFIAWQRIYGDKVGKIKTPFPKELFSQAVFKIMSITYILGFSGILTGSLLHIAGLIRISSALLVLAAVFYNWNVYKLITQKSITI